MLHDFQLEIEIWMSKCRHKTFPSPFSGTLPQKKADRNCSPMISWSTTNLHNLWTHRNFIPPHLRNSSHPIKTPLPYRENPSGHTFVPVNWWCQAAMGPTKVAELKHHGWMVMRRPKLEWIDVSISTDLEETLARRALCWKWTQEEDDKEISLQHRPPTLLAPIFHRDNPLGPLLVMTLTWGGIDTS